MNAAFRSLSVIALAAAALAARGQNLVTNGSFENGDLAGFSASGVLPSNQISGPNGVTHASDGQVFAAYGFNGTTSTLTQTVPTVAGTGYVLSFDLKPISGLSGNATPTSTFLVMFANAPVLSLTNPAPTSGYVSYSFPVASLLGNDTLSFSSTNGSAAYFALDNLKVQAAPEPSALAALGVGMVAVLRRRKRA